MTCFPIFFYQGSFLFHELPTNISSKSSLESNGPVMIGHVSEDCKVVCKIFSCFLQLFIEIVQMAENRKGSQLSETCLLFE